MAAWTQTAPGVSKDVQDKLMRERTTHRHAGGVPYPVKFSPKQLAYDNWNQMFLTSLCRSITMHQFETPPSKVLDLGCGTGLWVLEAAKQWTSSTFVGFDVLRVQPNLGRSKIASSISSTSTNNFASRIQWMHGNFLERLPFESGHFDFIRLCCLGMGVPEDEWQDLLQEVSRVLKPGGIVEIIEEDLIFPSGKFQSNAPYEPFGESTLSIPLSIMDSNLNSTSVVLTSASATSVLTNGRSTKSVKSTARKSVRIMTPTEEIPPLPLIDDSERPSSLSMPAPTVPDYESLLHPQDHNKLKQAWNNMLLNRFLASKVVSVLQLYLSTEFGNVQTHPPLQIPLPPNSDSLSAPSTEHLPGFSLFNSENIPEVYIDLKSQSIRNSTDSRNGDAVSHISRRSSPMTISNWAPMHLARTVSFIEGCRDAIWEEYRAIDSLNGVEAVNTRYEFEVAWSNWHNDMLDRTAMRDRIHSSLSWSASSGKERPDWRIWRDRVGTLDSDLLSLSPNPQNADMELCRSLRGFVAWKSL